MRQDIARARKGDIPVPVHRVIPTPGASPTLVPISPKPKGKALKAEEHRIILLEKAHIKAAHCP